jgi:hypothetical protein
MPFGLFAFVHCALSSELDALHSKSKNIHYVEALLILLVGKTVRTV